ncbi:fatty acid/sphingolipid desaturase [Dissoconium aciculare CBS 342.82]|uniref:Delta 8-(E)-sphingolipid desaturase n=1 Tax=Dissoconium aciculare CBS 342.82 TaxID=1314786 RepID=A0A6J3LZH9_9PEZI|nr:fatty acid/sphingolipid desaturase [Dissoconium aciculare CBS 342.82]KAF1820669.1 fatty acid/sphingolipid desaturase [Dissoconium aciculare CBS 342.82]
MAAARPTARSKDIVLERRKIEALIAEGRKVIIVEGKVLKVDAWLPYHPGGDKAILHMVGRDATNEVKAFHSAETQQMMLRYQIGKVDGQWIDYLPPIQGGKFRQDNGEPAQSNTPAAESDDESTLTESSQESSPLFEPAHGSTMRRRFGSSSALSESSSTSVESLALDGSEEKVIPKSAADERTQRELQHDLETFPKLDSATQGRIIQLYQQLDQRLRDEGLYDCNYKAYAREIARYTALAIVSLFCLRQGWYVASATFLGALWHQLVFTVHDAGHMGITHDFQTDSLIGIFVANWIGGLSCCWWKRNHNVHHIVTNSAEHDPDIQHMPFFAITHRFFDGLTSSYYDRVMTFDAVAKVTLKYQHYLYYPILALGRFNLYALSWQYILLGQGPRKGPAAWHRWLELAGQIFFWYWFGYLVVYKSIPTNGERFAFVMISHAVTMLVHVQITLSHFAMSTADLGVKESFPQRMLRTTMDVQCPEWLDFFHGGLQFQAVHHLFPRMPRHNLRAAQKHVMQFCDEVGIPYTVYGFVEGNGKVIGRLSEIAQQARILAECQRSMTVQDVFESH